jgi:hypothetical protein
LKLLTALALATALLAGCGGHARSTSPEDVVRQWSKALNTGDNEAAANLFAPGAEVVQGPFDVRLESHEMAVEFNASLPCSGEIVHLVRRGDVVTATFVLGDRPASRCDGPGQNARAAFTIRDGKIAVWKQIPLAQEGNSA